MTDTFLEGETYANSKLDHDIMVLAINSETDAQYSLAILKVDRETYESTGGGELVVLKKDLKDWKIVVI